MKDFNQVLDDLRNGRISECVITRDEFMFFREIWMKQTDRVHFVGEAGLNGQIIYRYQK